MPAPYESCVSCLRDTTTGFALVGEAEWIMGALHELTGTAIEDAEDTLLVYCEHDLGCDPGMVPDGEMTVTFRFCEACAQEAGVPVGDLSGSVPGYREGDER